MLLFAKAVQPMKKNIIYSLYFLLAAVFFLPVVATVIFSFSTEESFGFQNYIDLLFDCFVFYPAFWNSVFYAGITVLIELIIIIPCAFAFVSAKFKGKDVLLVFYVVLMMMPLQVTILPNYIGLRDLRLLDTHLCIILPAVFSPFGIVVMRQYMQGMDNSIIEAIRLETNSMMRVLIHCVIPQVKICIFAVAIFIFAESWNMLEQPMLFLKSENLQNLSVFISKAENYGGEVLFPASVIFFIPVLLLYSFFNDYLEKGLTFGDLAK